MTERELSFSLVGLPPNDNATRRMHWAAKGREVAVWRDAARWAALAALAGSTLRRPVHRCVVEYDFRVTHRHRQGVDALIGASKPVLDGIVDAGALPDDGWLIVVEVRGRVSLDRQAGMTVTVRQLE